MPARYFIHDMNSIITNIHWTHLLDGGMLATYRSGHPMNTSGNSMSSRRFAMLALMTAVVLATLDITISNTALPQIAEQLGVPNARVIWVANAYQIAMIAGLLPLAALGESIGYRRVYIAGVALFGGASLICGLATTFDWLVIGRALQGLGGAAIMSVNTAFIRHLYPPERLGQGLSVNAFIVAVSFAAGPPLAVLILSASSWHWLFLINVPTALLALPLAIRYLPDAAGDRLPFERTSGLLCAGFLGLLSFALCAMENGGGRQYASLALAIAAACFMALLRAQRGHPAPMLAVDLLKQPMIALSSLTSICAFATQALALIALPFFLQHDLGMSLGTTGLVLMSWPVFVALMALVVSPLSDRFSPAALCAIGLALLAVGMAVLARSTTPVSVVTIVGLMALCGIGFGLFQAPNLKAIMGSAPARRSGGASAIVGISRLFGQTIGAALVAQSFLRWHDAGPHWALWIGCATAASGAMISSLRLRERVRARAGDIA